MPSFPFNADDIDAIFFDMDGTLIDTDDADVSRWARRIARVYGGSVDGSKKAARWLVMALETPVNALFTLLDMVGLDTPVVRLMIALQGGTDQPVTPPPVDGVIELIEGLAGRYRLGVVSTRTTAESERFLTKMGIRQHFEVIAGRDSTWRIKPHPQPVAFAADALGVEPGRCLMVGDTTVDIRAGVRAGAWTCGVLCGYGQKAELSDAGAHVILEETALLSIVL